jgi:hypothetical protein
MLERIRRWRDRDAGDELGIPGLVHELRQPIMALDAGLRLLSRELGAGVTGREGWAIAMSQLARLNETLDGYAQLVATNAGAVSAFDVEPVLRRAVAQLRSRLQPLGDRFSLAVEEGVPRASGRPDALLHAVVNVLANAIEALERAGRPGRIELRARSGPGDPATAQVRVADEGAGIPLEQRRALFTLRYTTKPDPHGKHGIGLAFSRRVLRASGGDLRLAPTDDPARRTWARTEFVVDLAPVRAAAPAVAPRPRADRWRVVAVAAALAAAVAMGWRLMQHTLPGADAGEPATIVASDAPVVSALDGTLERRRGRGDWGRVSVGERLALDDVLRTPAGSTATLALGDHSRVALSDATQLAVRELTSALQRLRISRGRLSVDHQPEGARVIVIETERGDAAAKAGAAKFSVLSTGTSLAVATETGVVRLANDRGAVDVGGGRQAVAFRGAAPSRPAPIPRSILLRLANAASAGPPALCAIVEGTVRPGTEVRVDGELVDAGPDGRFTRRVARRRGVASVSVVTREVSGAVVERRVSCAEIDPRLQDFAVRWGTK